MVISTKYSRIILFALLALKVIFTSLSVHAQAIVQLNKTTMEIGEIVHLTLISDTSNQLPQQNLAPITDLFNIISNNFSQQIHSINGRIQQKFVWNYQVSPKKAGDFTIQGVRIGNEVAAPLTIKVVANKSLNQNSQQLDFLLLGTVDETSPYVQSEVIYSFKLLYRYQIINGQIQQLNIPGLKIKVIAQDNRGDTIHKGVRYKFIEWRYAFIPQRSGNIHIPALFFNGVVRTPNGDRQMRLQTVPLDLTVKPQPANWPKGVEWLPAKQLNIWEKWQPSLADWKVGQTVQRHIEVTVDGIQSSQIKPLNFPNNITKLRVYPQTPAYSDQVGGNGHQANYRHIVDYQATTTGRVVIPAIRIPWWDTVNDQLKYAVLPERHINVRATNAPPSIQPTLIQPTLLAPQNTQNTPNNGNNNENNNGKQTGVTNMTNQAQADDLITMLKNHLWFFSILASLWLLSIILTIILSVWGARWWQQRRQNKSTSQPKLTTELQALRLLHEMAQTIKKSDQEISSIYEKALNFNRRYKPQLSKELVREWHLGIQKMGKLVSITETTPTKKTMTNSDNKQLTLLINKTLTYLKNQQKSPTGSLKLYPSD